MRKKNLLLLIFLISNYVSWGQSIIETTPSNQEQFSSLSNENVACSIANIIAGTPVCTGGTETTVTYDDGWNFPLTITSSGTTNTTWQLMNPNNAGEVLLSGTYGQLSNVYIFNTYYGSGPGSAVTFTVRDSYDYSCTKTFTITQPSCSPAPCTGFSFSNYSVTCENGGLKVCFTVSGAAGRTWAASIKTSYNVNDHGVPLTSGTGNGTFCGTITSPTYLSQIYAYNASQLTLWGMPMQNGNPVYGDGCEIDYQIVYTPCTPSCPAPTPTGIEPSICIGNTASMTASGCTSGYTATWYSDINLTNKIATGNTYTTPALSTSTTYYVSCVSTTDATCRSIGVALTATVNPLPSLSTQSPVCATNYATYSVAVTSNGTISASAGTVSGNSVINIPAGTNVTITATLNGCTKSITVNSPTCTASCITPNAGADITICLPKTTADLPNAPSGMQWVVGIGNPTGTTINASTGLISGMTVAGTYHYVLQTIGNTTCNDEVLVIVTNGDVPIVLCNDGSTSTTLVAPSNLTNVVWYNSAGQQVGTGYNLVVTSNTTGLQDSYDIFFYRGIDNTGSTVEQDCPVRVITEVCCINTNCIDIKTIK